MSEELKAQVCKSCGAEIKAGEAFCTKCGAPVQPEAAPADPAPTGVIDPFDTPPQSANTPDPHKCKKCGADIAPGTAFCTVCGEPVNGNADSANGNAAPQISYCKKCGGKIEGMPEFCKNCGKPTADGVDKDNKRARKRTVSLITYLSGAVIAALVGFIFLCTSFLKISVMGVEVTKQSGLNLIGMIFGGSSLITSMGVSSALLRWAGWLYLAYILAIVETIICIVLNFRHYKKGDRPFGVITGISAMFVASIGILVVSLIAKSNVQSALNAEIGSMGGAEASMALSMIEYFTGGIGVFVVALIGFALCMFAVVYSYGTYEKAKRKLEGDRRTFLIVDIAMAVILIVFAVLTALNPFGNKEYAVSPGDSGTAKIKCRDEISYMGESMYFGVVVFKLEGLEEAESYTFTLDADFGLSASQMEDCMCLVYYDDVKGADAMQVYDLLAREDYLATNQVSRPDHAELSFINGYNEDLAIVVGFSATGKMTDEFDYSFKVIA